MTHNTFEVKDDFYLDNEPFKIISGSIHYFRVVPEYWQDRLEKLKAMGCNTVETYVPWNFHEFHEGEFNFEKGLDLRRFIQLAKELDLLVILRPSPYICAEWEYGGLPYWLLKDPAIKVRFNHPSFMDKIDRYFDKLFKEVVDLQITQGGPIILMQVENEYGGFANDKGYLLKMAELMRKHGVEVPLVTSDGPWGDMLENGSISEIALPTMNCGSKVTEYFKRLSDFHGEKKPLMVMEFWIGWFDAWGDDKHHTTEVADAVFELECILKEGSVNFYMFHGGTNFGFTSGANYYEKLAPDVTSYDYDAPLTEWGDITPKYEAFKQVISTYRDIPSVEFSTPIIKKAYGTLKATEKTSLFNNLDRIGKKTTHNFPLSMEQLNQGTGYVFYKSDIGKNREIEDFRLIGCNDRAQVYINQEHLVTQYDQEIETNYPFTLTENSNELGILVENMGRVNYSVKMNYQEKGIKDGVVINGAFQSDWEMYSLPMDNLDQLDFSEEWQENQPGFYRFEWEVAEIGDTFLDVSGWSKGFVVVNGFNIGRFWDQGPQGRLYISGPLLKQGVNELIVFESEGKSGSDIQLVAEPLLDINNK